MPIQNDDIATEQENKKCCVTELQRPIKTYYWIKQQGTKPCRLYVLYIQTCMHTNMPCMYYILPVR